MCFGVSAVDTLRGDVLVVVTRVVAWVVVGPIGVGNGGLAV